MVSDTERHHRVLKRVTGLGGKRFVFIKWWKILQSLKYYVCWKKEASLGGAVAREKKNVKQTHEGHSLHFQFALHCLTVQYVSTKVGASVYRSMDSILGHDGVHMPCGDMFA